MNKFEKRKAHYTSRNGQLRYSTLDITVIVTTMATYAATTFGIDETGPALEVDEKKERSVYTPLSRYCGSCWGDFAVIGILFRSSISIQQD